MRSQLVLAGLLVPALVLPQSAAAPPVDSITVSAYRTPQPLNRAGSAVSVVDRNLIEVRQNSVAAEALRSVPGLAIARSGPIGAQTQIRMRGGEANQVLVLIDGVEANDLATADEFSFEHLTTFDIERMEVVRGPQSALWGSDALAGVINVVTRSPTEPLEAEAFLDGGSFGLVNGGARLGMRSDRTSFVVSGSEFRTDGTNVSRVGDEDDGYENTTGTLRADFRWLPTLTFGLSARHTDSTTEFDGIDSAITGLPADAENETDATQSYVRFGGGLDLMEGRWRHDLRYTITETDTDTIAEDLSTAERDFDSSSVEGDKYGLYYQTSVQVTVDREGVPGDVLTVAGDHERQEFRQRGEVLAFPVPVPGTLYDPNQDEGVTTTGYAAEYLAYLGSNLVVSGSVRRDDNSDFDDVTTWRATISQDWPGVGTRLHASFGTGQKTPTFVERFGFYPNQFVGNPDLEPERSKGWDLGLEQRALDGRVVIDLTYFQVDLDNEINGFYLAPGSSVATARNNPGESRRKGAEVTLDAALSDRYALSASYTYTDAEGDDPNTPVVELVREVRRPLHAASLNLTGRWLNNRLTLNGGAFYTGDREDDFFPPPFFFPAQRVGLDSYTLLNLAASFDLTPQVTVYGRIENTLDEDYEDVYGFNTPGAGAFAGVRVSFGR